MVDKNIVDCWDVKGFDSELSGYLEDNAQLILDYFKEDRRLLNECLASDPYESMGSNRYSADFQHFKEHILTPAMRTRKIRVWHYTRMLDWEVVAMQSQLSPASLEGLKARLSKLVQDGVLSSAESAVIYDSSPYHDQAKARLGKVWTTVLPLPVHDHGVEPLLESWGGEGAYFWLRDQAISQKLRTIGAPRIVEIETSPSTNIDAWSVSETIIRSFGNSLGLDLLIEGCDLAIREDFDKSAVLRIHTEGDETFKAVGNSYPLHSGAILSQRLG